MTSRPVVLRIARPYSAVTASTKGSPEDDASGTKTKSMSFYGRHPLKCVGTVDCEAASPRCKDLDGRPARMRTDRQTAPIPPAGHILILEHLSVQEDLETGVSASNTWVQTRRIASLAGTVLQGISARSGGASA